MKILKMLLLAFTMGAISLYAQEPIFQAKVSLSAAEIFLDETVDIQLNLTFPKEYFVDVDALQAHLMRNSSFEGFPFSLVTEPKILRLVELDTIQETLIFTLQPQVPGIHTLSFLNIPFSAKGAAQVSIKEIISDIVQVEVKMPVSNLNEIQPAAPLSLAGQLPLTLSPSNALKVKALFFSAEALQHTEAEWQARKFPWEKIGMTLGGLLAGLILWILARDKQAVLVSYPSKNKEAKKAFKDLKQAHLLEKEQLALFIERLSGILKTYLKEQAGVRAEVLTTEELVAQVASKEIQQFFIKADRVKFAAYTPSLAECQQAEAFVKAYLEYT